MILTCSCLASDPQSFTDFHTLRAKYKSAPWVPHILCELAHFLVPLRRAMLAQAQLDPPFRSRFRVQVLPHGLCMRGLSQLHCYFPAGAPRADFQTGAWDYTFHLNGKLTEQNLPNDLPPTLRKIERATENATTLILGTTPYPLPRRWNYPLSQHKSCCCGLGNETWRADPLIPLLRKAARSGTGLQSGVSSRDSEINLLSSA